MRFILAWRMFYFEVVYWNARRVGAPVFALEECGLIKQKAQARTDFLFSIGLASPDDARRA